MFKLKDAYNMLARTYLQEVIKIANEKIDNPKTKEEREQEFKERIKCGDAAIVEEDENER